MVIEMTRPNIVLLFPDQMRADFLGCYGAGFAKTPNIDKLCAESLQYRDAISPAPICIAARASLLTGFNCIKTGVFTNDQWLRPDHSACGMPTWPELLSGHGYHTEGIGKMHFYPWDIKEGFDHRVIAEDKRHLDIEDDKLRFDLDGGNYPLLAIFGFGDLTSQFLQDSGDLFAGQLRVIDQENGF